MRLVVISSAPVVIQENEKFLYAPYEKEMQLWVKYANESQFCCPVWKDDKKLLITKVSFPILPIIELKEFDVLSLKNAFSAISKILNNLFVIYSAMQQADHIHIRCPGNIGLLACFVQIFFPNKKKTVKYAGNWDPKSKQPLSYRIQKWILSNTFFTKNTKVLVYGKWKNSSKNIKPFFTATYTSNDMKPIPLRSFNERIEFVFVGMLSVGKQPLYVAELIKVLISKKINVRLRYFGEGVLKDDILRFVNKNKLQSFIFLEGNQPKEVVEKAYQESHFLVLPSKSEGWPKVVAEAMFWGCVPLVSSVSCVSYMLKDNERGVLLTEDLEKDIDKLNALISNEDQYFEMATLGMNWSRKFTMDKFENEIQKLLLK
ncbi:glycosyltransferase [Flavobacterium sp.]|jgi:glycosyltransferase involved in cell wall biosynthesis|uniref:glycosyltransferase family 4 protein n=1 Tax=Flavobacterium sp. TaxID=239 RepID=UPI002A7F276C|nr:glycosyltransferase [Flavobacterium sp.]